MKPARSHSSSIVLLEANFGRVKAGFQTGVPRLRFLIIGLFLLGASAEAETIEVVLHPGVEETALMTVDEVIALAIESAPEARILSVEGKIYPNRFLVIPGGEVTWLIRITGGRAAPVLGADGVTRHYNGESSRIIKDSTADVIAAGGPIKPPPYLDPEIQEPRANTPENTIKR